MCTKKSIHTLPSGHYVDYVYSHSFRPANSVNRDQTVIKAVLSGPSCLQNGLEGVSVDKKADTLQWLWLLSVTRRWFCCC